MFKEPEMISAIKRMIAVYLESYPNDREVIERFQRWIFHIWGYKDGDS